MQIRDAGEGRWHSFAKVNLCLRIVGRRADGYHLLDSLFLPIDLCDDVALTVRDVRAGAPLRVTVDVDDPETPRDATNLAARAAHALLEACGLGGTVAIALRKRIPVGAGLGGGSSNAASVLCGLNEVLALGVSDARLCALGAHLGADVPFFLVGVPARVGGIGEEVVPLTRWPATTLVVVVPPVRVATSWAFARYREGGPAGDAPPPGEPEQLARGATPTPALLVNDLERVVLPAFPVIADVKARLEAAGASAAVMSGSGSAVVGLAPSATAGGRMAAALRAAVPGGLVHVATVPAVG